MVCTQYSLLSTKYVMHYATFYGAWYFLPPKKRKRKKNHAVEGGGNLQLVTHGQLRA